MKHDFPLTPEADRLLIALEELNEKLSRLQVAMDELGKSIDRLENLFIPWRWLRRWVRR